MAGLAPRGSSNKVGDYREDSARLGKAGAGFLFCIRFHLVLSMLNLSVISRLAEKYNQCAALLIFLGELFSYLNQELVRRFNCCLQAADL